ncbi:MAG: MBOAT family protein [Bacteroidales bacterium]|nr:MBOAT family protein [Bacteroidales bacterium]
MNTWNFDVDKLLQLFVCNPKEPLIFNSGMFLFVFCGFLILYNLVKKNLTMKVIWVLLFSYYFYYKSSGFYLVFLLISTVLDYLIGLQIGRVKTQMAKKCFVFLSVSFHLALLGYFKYFNLTLELFANITHQTFEFQRIFLPIGISFWTFESISYIVDVYRKQLQPVKRFMDYAFYISFFPALVAGPIVRAKDFIPQIANSLVVTREMFGNGIFLIFAGLFKKAIISDYIGLNFVDRIFDNPSLYTGFENLMGMYGYSLQIYCDFSGYSDMAIGIALLLGFRLKANFDSPYKSASVTEFWRRWHISLSSWLKDYLYIALGGNKKGKLRTYFNLFITMLLGGLWHGASLKFVFWGGLHGLSLIVHKLLMRLFPWMKVNGSEMSAWQRLFGVLLTFHIVSACWVFFRADSFAQAIEVFNRIFTAFHPEVLPQFVLGYKVVFSLMILGYLLHFVPQQLETRVNDAVIRMPLVLQAVAITLLIIFIFQIKSAEIQPFIYFQF